MGGILSKVSNTFPIIKKAKTEYISIPTFGSKKTETIKVEYVAPKTDLVNENETNEIKETKEVEETQQNEQMVEEKEENKEKETTPIQTPTMTPPLSPQKTRFSVTKAPEYTQEEIEAQNNKLNVNENKTVDIEVGDEIVKVPSEQNVEIDENVQSMNEELVNSIVENEMKEENEIQMEQVDDKQNDFVDQDDEFVDKTDEFNGEMIMEVEEEHHEEDGKLKDQKDENAEVLEEKKEKEVEKEEIEIPIETFKKAQMEFNKHKEEKLNEKPKRVISTQTLINEEIKEKKKAKKPKKNKKNKKGKKNNQN